ncbi:hypothetical protein ACRCJW_09665 [Aerococcus urinaeequi]|uniref:hypothetical protein n=1 Tax=Aerococcus urinaeequi TaxID=51665 RepID=UPI003D6A9F03
MLHNEIKQIDLQKFEEKYPFEQLIHTSKEDLKAGIKSGDLHYVWLPACPRANRITSVFKWYGLDKRVKEHQLSPYYKPRENWVFQAGDKLFEETSIQDYFPKEVRATQPFLYNESRKQVLSNHTYSMSMLMAEVMDEVNKVEPQNSLYPTEHREMLQKWNAWIYEKVNLNIYQVTSKSGKEKEEGMQDLETTYGLLNAHLSSNNYLHANQLTETDLRLFNNLIRHELYFKQFKVFKRPLADFTHLNQYVQYILVEHPIISDDLYFKEIRETHFRSDHNIKKYGYVEKKPSINELFPF